MKQFGKILKFELKGYLRNKVFVGITIFLVVAIAIVMFIPNILTAIESEEGGNTAPTEAALIDINEELGFPVYFTGYWMSDDKAQPEILETQSGMIHACESETSMVLSYDETLVDPVYKETKGNPGYPLEVENNGILHTFHRMEMHTENGVMGNSYMASKEKGDRMTERFVDGFVKIFSDDRIWNQPV